MVCCARPVASVTTPAINRQMHALEWGMLLLLAIIWGGSFFFNSSTIALYSTSIFARDAATAASNTFTDATTLDDRSATSGLISVVVISAVGGTG